MWIIGSLWGIILLLILGMIVLGFWPVLWDVVERRGRLNSHLMIDYSLAYMVFSLILSLALGSVKAPKDGVPNLIPQLHQSNGPLVGFVMLGGLCGAFADVCSKFAITLMGLVIAPSLTQLAQIALSIILNFLLDRGLNNPALLFPGLGCACSAILLGCLAHLENQKSNSGEQSHFTKQKSGHLHDWKPLDEELNDSAGTSIMVDISSDRHSNLSDLCKPPRKSSYSADKAIPLHTMSTSHQLAASGCSQLGHDLDDAINTAGHHFEDGTAVARPQHSGRIEEAETDASPKASASEQQQQQQESGQLNSSQRECRLHQPGPAECSADEDCRYLQNPIEKPQPLAKVQRHGILQQITGIALALGGGGLYGLYSAGWNVACNDPFDLLKPGIPPLSIYTTYFYNAFVVGVAMAGVNAIFLFCPPMKADKSSFTAWIWDGNARGLSCLAGIVASIGEGIQLMGGQVAGYAFSNIAQAYPLVSTFIGIVVFRQFHGASRQAKLLLAGQQVFYVATIALLAASGKQRENIA